MLGRIYGIWFASQINKEDKNMSWRKCKCENLEHDKACDREAEYKVPTIYGRYELCYYCMKNHTPELAGNITEIYPKG